ncbi:E3 ubiquitin ligase family protein [Natronosalvus halobius]|uniref:E3 ubiquitin ligase family protein n=1 Tax=Natronosalvus halobius TaxID=2953746 RepID=UPI00209F1F3C|nr:E3 ubiquitin ligase family protein [Natronosalvus halobius]USZ73033.1 E3 ubiquitin ligase family protein [Natronosalvus halobius]
MSVLLLSLAALGALLGVALLAYGLRELGLAHRIFAREPHTVLDTPNDGFVELSGTVLAWDDVLESPFTETGCVAVEYTVEEKRRKSTNNGSRTKWVEIDGGTRVVPFRLEDETGNVLVDPQGADLRLTVDTRIRVEGGEAPPAPIARYIERDEDVSDENTSLSLGPLEISTGRDRRYLERRLDLGEAVHLLGTARRDTTASRETGQVNAVVERSVPPEPGLLARVRHRLLGPPFLLFDVTDRRAALRVAVRGLVSALAGVLFLALSLSFAVGVGGI